MALTKEGKVPDLYDQQHTHDTRTRQLISLSLLISRGSLNTHSLTIHPTTFFALFCDIPTHL